MDFAIYFLMLVGIPILFYFGIRNLFSSDGLIYIGLVCMVLAVTLSFAAALITTAEPSIDITGTSETVYTYSAMIRTGPTVTVDYNWKNNTGSTMFVTDDDAYIESAQTVRTVTYLPGTGVNFSSTYLDTTGGWAEEIRSTLPANSTIVSLSIRGTIDDGISDPGTVCTWPVYLRGPGVGSTIEQHDVYSRVGPTAFDVTFHDFTSLRSYFVVGVQSDFADPFSRGDAQQWTNAYCNVWGDDNGDYYYEQSTAGPEVSTLVYDTTQTVTVTSLDIVITEPTPASAVTPITPVVLSEQTTDRITVFALDDLTRNILAPIFCVIAVVGILTIFDSMYHLWKRSVTER